MTVESKADATITVDTEKEKIHGETEINVTDNMKYQLEAILKGDTFEDGKVTELADKYGLTDFLCIEDYK